MSVPRRVAIALAAVVALGVWIFVRSSSPSRAGAEWSGVDESVIGRFVAEAGHPAPRPLFDWLQGDLLLFAFLWAGLIAGFILGYWGRAVFGATAQRAAATDRERNA